MKLALHAYISFTASSVSEKLQSVSSDLSFTQFRGFQQFVFVFIPGLNLFERSVDHFTTFFKFLSALSR